MQYYINVVKPVLFIDIVNL